MTSTTDPVTPTKADDANMLEHPYRAAIEAGARTLRQFRETNLELYTDKEIVWLVYCTMRAESPVQARPPSPQGSDEEVERAWKAACAVMQPVNAEGGVAFFKVKEGIRAALSAMNHTPTDEGLREALEAARPCVVAFVEEYGGKRYRQLIRKIDALLLKLESGK